MLILLTSAVRKAILEHGEIPSVLTLSDADAWTVREEVRAVSGEAPTIVGLDYEPPQGFGRWPPTLTVAGVVVVAVGPSAIPTLIWVGDQYPVRSVRVKL